MQNFNFISYFNTQDNIEKYCFKTVEQKPKIEKINLHFSLTNIELKNFNESNENDTTIKIRAILFFFFFIGTKAKLSLLKVKGQSSNTNFSVGTLLNSKKSNYTFLNSLYLENSYKSTLSLHKKNWIIKNAKNFTINSTIEGRNFARVNALFTALFYHLRLQTFSFKTSYTFSKNTQIEKPFAFRTNVFPLWGKVNI